jgi:hypothetical protein
MTQPAQHTRGWKSRIALAFDGKAHSFWLLCAAIFLPFGWVFWLLQVEPVRTFVKSLRRNLL